MSYTGFVRPILGSYPFNSDCPKILEIGVDKGQSTFPIVQNLSSRFSHFLYYGVDVFLRQQTFESIIQFYDVSVVPIDERSTRNVVFAQENSLDWLVKNKNNNPKFDIVFLDGDHNYHTVSKELKLLQSLMHPQSIIICDDFNGRHAFKDSFYGEREEYKNIKNATRKTESEKQGVQTAVRDFIGENTDWKGFQWPSMEPCVLYRSDVWEDLEVKDFPEGKEVKLRDMIFNFNLKNTTPTSEF